MQETDKIWMNGELVDWARREGPRRQSTGSTTASGVFEGIRCYETPEGPGRLPACRSPPAAARTPRKLLYMDIPYSVEELREATHELVARERPRRPATSARSRSSATASSESHARRQPRRDGDHELPLGRLPRRGGPDERGSRATVSSWKRVGPNVIPHVAKATGIYLNSMLATTEAQRAGYDEAIMLTRDGYVADGPGREHLRRQGRRASSRRRSRRRSCRASPATRSSSRAGPRLPGRGDAHHPHRPRPRGRGVHARDRDGGDAGARGRRARDRRRPDHARAPAARTSTPSTAATHAGAHWLDVVERHSRA